MSDYLEQCDGPDLRVADDARIQKEFLDYRVAAYLTRKGWKHSSSNPASIWLWEKKLDDGRTVLVADSTALLFQSVDEGDPDADGDEP